MSTLKRTLLPVISIVLTVLIFNFVFFIGGVPSTSMEPTLNKGSIIFGTRIFSNIDAGDIVVFRHSNKLCVKRVAVVGPNEITVDGNRYEVPEGSAFMLGDNTEYSYDSRYWEEPFIKTEEIIAKVIRL